MFVRQRTGGLSPVDLPDTPVRFEPILQRRDKAFPPANMGVLNASGMPAEGIGADIMMHDRAVPERFQPHLELAPQDTLDMPDRTQVSTILV